jgi:hypothetical protein
LAHAPCESKDAAGTFTVYSPFLAGQLVWSDSIELIASVLSSEEAFVRRIK